MPTFPLEREIAFTLKDVARMLGTYADQQGRAHGISAAQWTVLVRLDRCEGLKQSELADVLDLQPISLTRLLDRLADNGLIERRADPNDRRANRLYLTPAARPLLQRLGELSKGLMGTVLDGLGPDAREQLLRNLSVMKNNLRTAISRTTTQPQASKVIAS